MQEEIFYTSPVFCFFEDPPGCQNDLSPSPLTSQRLKSCHLSAVLSPRCSPDVWIDYLLLKTRRDRAGHQRESKTKSQISQTLYQSNILEAQSHSHYLQESQRLQRETCEGFFLTSERGIVVDQQQCLLSFDATRHNLRMILRLWCIYRYGINVT